MAWRYLAIGGVGLLTMLGGCSTTPIGEQLGNSFGPSPDAPKPIKQTSLQPKPPNPELPKPDVPKPAAQKPEAPKPEAQKFEVQKPSIPAAAPVPYRVVLRLPSTDPAAPAEALTKALRAANLPFEVETIERVRPVESPGNNPPNGR